MGELIPVNVPLLFDLTFMSNALLIFLRWWRDQNRRGVETGCFFHPDLSPLLDPPLSLPPSIGGTLFVELNTHQEIIAMNARGIVHRSFRLNFMDLYHHHCSDVFIVTETRVSRPNTETIVRKLPWLSWTLMEPEGFNGGVLVLWNNLVDFHVITKNKQGIHGVI